MKFTDKRRLEIGAYIVITALAVPSYILAKISGDTLLRDLFVNLSATFAGVGFLFFLLNRFFGLEHESSEKINEIYRKIIATHDVLLTHEERQQRFATGETLQSATQIDIVGFTLIGLLGQNHEVIIKRVQQGGKFRVILIDPSSKAPSMINELWRVTTINADLQSSINFVRIIQDAITKSNKVKGSFEVRVLPWILSTTILIIDSKLQSGKAQVAITNPHFDTPTRKRLWLILEKNTNDHWFNYFADQFEMLWEKSKIWNPPYE